MKRKTVLQLMFLISVCISVFLAMGIYLWVMNNKQEIVLPVSARPITKNSRMLKGDVTFVKVNPNVMSPKMISSEFDIIGNYSLRDMNAGEYFYADWISASIARRLADRVVYGAVPISTNQLLSVNGEVRADDFVMVTIITSAEGDALITNVAGVPTKKVRLIEPPELSALRVLGIVDASGQDINYKKQNLQAPNGTIDSGSSLPQGSILIFDCNEIQRAMLLQASYSGLLQVIILPEAEQQAHRLAWGLTGELEDEEEVVSVAPQLTPEQLEERRKQLQDVSDAEVAAEVQKAADEQGVELTPVEISDDVTGNTSDERG